MGPKGKKLGKTPHLERAGAALSADAGAGCMTMTSARWNWDKKPPLILKIFNLGHLHFSGQPDRSRFKSVKLWVHFIFLCCLLLKASGLCLPQGWNSMYGFRAGYATSPIKVKKRITSERTSSSGWLVKHSTCSK